MRQQTRRELTDVLRAFATDQLPKLTQWSFEDLRIAYPFHRLIFPDSAVLAARAERSIVTAMGNTLYPALARIIASDRFQDIHTNHPIEGTVNDAACNMIEQIVTELRARRGRGENRRVPNHPNELRDILNSRGGGQSSRSVTADLYIGDFIRGPLFVELKSPKPNLDVAAESKRKMLYFLTIMDRRHVQGASAFLGLTYNPYLTRQQYGHSYTRQIMDMEHEVLIGQELWDHLGGPDTYSELLDLIEEIPTALPNP